LLEWTLFHSTYISSKIRANSACCLELVEQDEVLSIYLCANSRGIGGGKDHAKVYADPESSSYTGKATLRTVFSRRG